MRPIALALSAAVLLAAPAAALACDDLAVPVYFASETAEVNTLGKEVISQAADLALACPVREISVTGEGPMGDQRAKAVAAALAAAGIDRTRIHVRTDPVAFPMARRVMLEVDVRQGGHDRPDPTRAKYAA